MNTDIKNNQITEKNSCIRCGGCCRDHGIGNLMTDEEAKKIFEYVQKTYGGKWNIRNSLIRNDYGNMEWEWKKIDQYNGHCSNVQDAEWIWMEYCVFLDDLCESGSQCMIQSLKPKACAIYQCKSHGEFMHGEEDFCDKLKEEIKDEEFHKTCSKFLHPLERECTKCGNEYRLSAYKQFRIKHLDEYKKYIQNRDILSETCKKCIEEMKMNWKNIYSDDDSFEILNDKCERCDHLNHQLKWEEEKMLYDTENWYKQKEYYVPLDIFLCHDVDSFYSNIIENHANNSNDSIKGKELLQSLGIETAFGREFAFFDSPYFCERFKGLRGEKDDLFENENLIDIMVFNEKAKIPIIVDVDTLDKNSVIIVLNNPQITEFFHSMGFGNIININP